MICLNVGCHDIHMEGFVNIDLDPAMMPTLLADATKLRDHFQEGSVDFIYCGHFLEHLSQEQGRAVVSDFFALLKPYGSVVAVVPDADACVLPMSLEQRERIIMAEGDHKILINNSRLLSYFQGAGFLTVTPISPTCLGHCPFPEVTWQTAVMALKHNPIRHHSPSKFTEVTA